MHIYDKRKSNIGPVGHNYSNNSLRNHNHSKVHCYDLGRYHRPIDGEYSSYWRGYKGQKSSNWIALETRFKAANGKKCLRSWKLKDLLMCHCLFRSLMTSAIEQQKNILISKLF